MQNKGTHLDISEIFWFIDQKSLSAVVYQNKHCLSLDFVWCMMGQHTVLEKYWRSSHLARTADLQYSCYAGWNACFAHWSVHQRWKMSFNQWIDLPSWYAASENEQTLCRRQTYILMNEQQKVYWQPKNWDSWSMILHYHIIIWERIFCYHWCTELQRSMAQCQAHPSGSLPPRRVLDLRYRTSNTISKTSISYAHSISTFCTFDIVFRYRRYRRYSISKVSLFDIEGQQPSMSNVNNRVTDIEVSWLWYRLNPLRYCMLISYTISKVTLTFDIEGHVIKYLDSI